MRELATIVVPVFGRSWHPLELALLLHARKVMPEFSLVFVGPESRDMSEIKTDFPEATIYKFDPAFFEDKQGYARLLLRPDFYEMFGWSEFLLLFEPGSYITKNELHYWCKQGHDYICDSTGRLSLRHVDKFLSLVRKNQRDILHFLAGKADSDHAFWQKKAGGFWPALRSPTTVVSEYFSQPIDAVTPGEKAESFPFAITGLAPENTRHQEWLNTIEIKTE